MIEALVELEELIAGAETKALPTADFAGSLEFIDSLATRRPLTLKSGLSTLGRDADVISNALFLDSSLDGRDSIVSDNKALPRVKFLTDNRMWSPMDDYNPGELVKGAGILQDLSPDNDPFIRRIGESPDQFWTEFDKSQDRAARRIKKSIAPRLSFTDPLRMIICLKRKMRRIAIFASGHAGVFHRPRRFNPYSRVRC